MNKRAKYSKFSYESILTLYIPPSSLKDIRKKSLIFAQLQVFLIVLHVIKEKRRSALIN